MIFTNETNVFVDMEQNREHFDIFFQYTLSMCLYYGIPLIVVKICNSQRSSICEDVPISERNNTVL